MTLKQGGAGQAPAAGERPRLLDRLLGLVEQGIGKDVAVPEAEWQALRALAAGQPRSLELVERFRGIVAECAAEIEKRRVAGDDVKALRLAILEHVRTTVAAGQSPLGGSAPAGTNGKP